MEMERKVVLTFDEVKMAIKSYLAEYDLDLGGDFDMYLLDEDGYLEEGVAIVYDKEYVDAEDVWDIEEEEEDTGNYMDLEEDYMEYDDIDKSLS